MTDETSDTRCYHNRWHPTEPRCPNEAVVQGAHLGNMTDGWLWCAEHMPPPEYREPIKREDSR